MIIRYSQIYANTEILSPIDRETWQIIGESGRLNSSSRVLELASGKGACARYLAKRFGCRVEGFDADPEFVEYSNRRAGEEGLASLTEFRCCDINDLKVERGAYDLGVCLGALYIFREAGLRILIEGVRPEGFLAISNIFCKKVPAPQALMDVFFEEEGAPLTLQELRQFYAQRGFSIFREVECSRKAWLEYYDLIREVLRSLAKANASNDVIHREIAKEMEEDRLIREYGEEFVGYMTFLMSASFAK